MAELFTLHGFIAFITLVALELVLGIDNVIFISILAAKLPKDQQQRARSLGLSLAVGTRVILLLSLSWVIGLVEPMFTLLGQEISGRDLILIGGGLFLIGKSTHEIHQKIESVDASGRSTGRAVSFSGVITQILLLDIVFSLDSVITAVGMVNNIAIMIAAVLVSAVIMVITAAPISNFVDRHPTIKILALSFLLLIGATLVAEGFDQHFSKSYIYFAMAFSLFIEMLNGRMRASSSR